MRDRSRGFSLIEVIVVLAIVGLLASIVITSLLSAQNKERDTKRIGDIDSIKHALAAYYISYGNYPIARATTTITATSTVGSALLSSGTMSIIPQDPRAYQYSYSSNSTGSNYSIHFCLETDSIRDHSPGCDNYSTP